jgi:creatinine amidohydrolase
MICDACISLAENGIQQIIILNGHHGNMGALQYISQELTDAKSKTVEIHTIHYWHMMKNEFDHAGEVETSLVLAIAPELVKMDKAKPNSKKLSKSKVAYSSITNAPGSFPKITGNGVWGDPRKATVEKGRKWIEEITAELASTIRELN